MEGPLNFQIRRMQPSDIPQVVAIENCWDYLSKWGEAGYLGVLGEPFLFSSWVAETNLSRIPSRSGQGSLIGAAVLALMVDHAELCNLIVLPQHLGKEVGQRLLGRCLEVVRQRSLNLITLEVRHSNRRAIRFYRRNGFRITSRQRNYYRAPLEDAWVMERPTALSRPRTGGPGCRHPEI